MKREFTVDTPLGKLRVWAKHDEDYPDDFPGVYIDLVRQGEDDAELACVEYNPCYERLQTCVYQPAEDETAEIFVHEIPGEEETT